MDYTLCYWPVPFRGQFIRAILAYAGKSWNETDDVSGMTYEDPAKQPVPFMGPPMLVDAQAGVTIAQMSAIALYLGETLKLIPDDPAKRAMTVKITNDANDLIDELTQQGGREMWTEKTWADFQPRLKRWMAIFEANTWLGTEKDIGVAEIVTATLWMTIRERFPAIGETLDKEAPRVAALSRKVWETPALKKLADRSEKEYGKDTYCGGQIGQSLNKVAGDG